MVFHCKCFEFPSPTREYESDGELYSQTKSSSSETKKASSQTKESSTGSYYSAHMDFGERQPESSNGLEVFSYLELKQATGNFSLSSKIGEGEFGSVYKAVIRRPHNKLEVAVKHLYRGFLQGDKEWKTEVNSIGSVQHPNLVKLLGYCAGDSHSAIHRLLVYEYCSNGSVKDHLSSQSESPPSWVFRLKVTLDAACCLAYLHEQMDFQVVFGNFKSSNVLLDDQWIAKLSDFAVGRLSPSVGLQNASRAVENYVAPEYHLTGNATSKTDVWSFGVFLYELIVGRLPFDQSDPEKEQKLWEWVKPYTNLKKIRQIVDSRLQGQYSLSSVRRLSIIAYNCLAKDPKSRPKMTDVLNMITGLVTETTLPLMPAPAAEECSRQEDSDESISSEQSELKGWRRFVKRKCGNNGCLCLPRICSSKIKSSP